MQQLLHMFKVKVTRQLKIGPIQQKWSGHLSKTKCFKKLLAVAILKKILVSQKNYKLIYAKETFQPKTTFKRQKIVSVAIIGEVFAM